jgi:hypothetical protein
MDSKDSIKPSEDVSLAKAGVEDKINLNQDANAPDDKSPATNRPPQIATAYEQSSRVKPNSGGTH